MRAMRSSLPVFLFIGIALIAIIGVMVLQSAATSASVEVGNTTTDDFSTGVYSIEVWVMYGIGALLFLVAGYFVLRGII